MDPGTALVAAGIATFGNKMASAAWDAGKAFFAKHYKDHGEAVRERAEKNATEFLVRLAVRVDRLEDLAQQAEREAQFRAAFDDPDVASVLTEALLGASRTSDPQKHDVLARAVAERIAAAPESVDALAANVAVETLPQLSAQHLSFLRLAAIVYAIRPAGLPPLREQGGPVAEPKPEQVAALEAYPDWLRATLPPLPEIVLAAADYAHLASAGLLLIDRHSKRSLKKVLDRYGVGFLSHAVDRVYYERMSTFHREDLFYTLTDWWEAGLATMTLTPAGLLVGTAAFDVGVDRYTPVDWALAASTSQFPEESVAWNGESVDTNFLRALGPAIKRQAQLGDSTWNWLSGRR